MSIILDKNDFIVVKSSNSFGDLILSLIDVQNMKTLQVESWDEGSWPSDKYKAAEDLYKEFKGKV